MAVAVGFCTQAERSQGRQKWDFLEPPASDRCPSLPLCRLGMARMFAKKMQPLSPLPGFLGSCVAFENVVLLVRC